MKILRENQNEFSFMLFELTSLVNLPDFFVSYNANIHLSLSSIVPRHNVDKQIRKSSNVT